ncbi:DUF2877 domain-containing protein [Schnuerera sp. xch1]|uniref:DUF2877 domain-containing protein n=1 Tax=Schnuerera sp. xch1 TaxID=2874283 RepID=UPI001CBEA82F|nr:DUF2877 domain-containing protein [Schnuerera sp. xch1]MBZ2175184.1 DUF2877 domain-containing protein [Schnuerera sp. xch1]
MKLEVKNGTINVEASKSLLFRGFDFMNSLMICNTLYKKILKGGLKGNIHSVFNSSFNVLDQNHQLVSFLNSKKPMSPNSIKIDNDISFLSLGIEPKLELQFFQSFALIEGLNIKITYDKVNFWDKNPVLTFTKDSKENVFRKLRIMSKLLIENGKTEGILPLLSTLQGKIKGLDLFLNSKTNLNKREKFIKERFLKFLDNYIREDIDNLSLYAKDIVGFGRGLTPAMDDFLCGIMVSRIYLSSYLDHDMERNYKVNRAIVEMIKNKTTIVSEEMLNYSSLGETNEDIRRLMLSFLGEDPFYYFVKNVKNVVKIGETSGTDILSGIYIGSSILLKWI